MLATSLAAGPLIGVAPGGRADDGADRRTGGTADVSLSASNGVDTPTPSAGPPVRRSAVPPSAPLELGLSPTTPLSKSRRHSGPTAVGSRRNSSYMA